MAGPANFQNSFPIDPHAPPVMLAGQWIKLPMPPTINHYYEPSAKQANGRHKFLGRGVRVYRRTVYYELRRLTRAPIRMIPGPIRLEVDLHFPTGAKNDLDNRMKGLQDALRLAGVFKDDSEIDELVVRRGQVLRDKESRFYGGECRVKVTTIGEANVP